MEMTIEGILLKQIPGFLSYWISCSGQVWSTRRKYNGVVGRWLKHDIDKREGRKRILVRTTDGVQKKVPIAHLVALAWIGPVPIDKPWVLHKDDNCTNDLYTNLYYGTPSNNAEDKLTHYKPPSGSNHWAAKITEDQAREIFSSSLPAKVFSRRFNIDEETVYRIRKRIVWKDATKDLVAPGT